MANLLLPTAAEPTARPASPSRVESSGVEQSGVDASRVGEALVASFGDPAAADFVEHVATGRPHAVNLAQPAAVFGLRGALRFAKISTCVLFLKPRLTESERSAVDALVAMLSEAQFITIVSTFRIHLADAESAAAEAFVLGRLKDLPARVVVLRVGHLISRRSRLGRWLRRFGWAYPLVPRRLRTCFADGGEVFATIAEQRRAAHSRRVVTLLGPNRPWRDVLHEQRSRSVWSACLSGLCFLLSLALVGQLAGLVVALLIRARPSLRHWNFDCLRPRSFAELLALCNRHNRQYVKIVGYNNGVVHFGHRYAGKTIVSTVCCKRIARRSADVIRADCGATIRDATHFLAATGQELPVLPNYSYVCLGTAFFVPIHGSAADYSTVAETIVKALLYDPARERFILATRDEAAFREHVYNPDSGVLALRLWIQVKPKASYFVRREERIDPAGEELLDALRDPQASNVEIRKSKAASATVRISTYFAAAACPSPAGNDAGALGTALEFPRDSLGRLWDRLEENPLTSFLMHAATRYFAWHVELFFAAEDFALFWKTHQALPLRKIQLRYIHRDGLPHSPFQEHDCVAVDLFMFRWKRRRFEAYLKQTFAVVRTNPGKHSQ